MQADDNSSRDKGQQELTEQANSLLSQLNYAGQVRSNYENQLVNLQAALQSERKNKGEHQLKLHDLEQAIESLKRNEAELLSQIEHWRRKAQAAMEQRALASSQPETQNQILLDIERLQQGEAYWRRQASHLTQQYEQAEDDVRRLIREVQTRAEMIKEKETTERALRSEIQALNQKLRESISVQSSPRTEMGSKMSTRNGMSYQDLDNEEMITNFAKVVKLQTILLHQGNYEEAERLALSFHDNPSVIQEIESARSYTNHSPTAHRDGQPNGLQTPRSERSIPSQWIRTSPSNDISPNTSNSQPNSTAPPLHQKLALENRLATFPNSSISGDSLQRIEPDSRWAIKVGILEAINLPQMYTSEGSLLPAEYYSCVSLVHAQTDFASPRLKTLEHIHGNHTARSWLLGQVHGIAWIQGHLKVRAMGKTSSVKYVNNAAHWAEAFVLRSVHADALEATNSMSEFSSESIPLDGRPAVILVTIHHAREESYGRLIARASLTIKTGEEFHQWYKLFDMDGKALLAGPSKPAMLRIRSAYSRTSPDEPTNEKLGSPKPRIENDKAVAIPAHSTQLDDVRAKGGENGAVVSATLGFFSMTSETDGAKPAALKDQGNECRTADHSSHQSTMVTRNSVIASSTTATMSETRSMLQAAPSHLHSFGPPSSMDGTEAERRNMQNRVKIGQPSPLPHQIMPSLPQVESLPMAGNQFFDAAPAHQPAHTLLKVTGETKALENNMTGQSHASTWSELQKPLATNQARGQSFMAGRENRPPDTNNSQASNSPPTKVKEGPGTRDVVNKDKPAPPFQAKVPELTSSNLDVNVAASKSAQDSTVTQPYVLPRAKVLPVQQVSPFKLQEMGVKDSKSLQNRPLSSKVADTIAKLDNSRRSPTAIKANSEQQDAHASIHDPDFVGRDNGGTNIKSTPPPKRAPMAQGTPVKESSSVTSGSEAMTAQISESAKEQMPHWVAKTVELTRTAPAGKSGSGRVGVGIAIASQGSGQPFVSALAPNGPAKLSGQILEGDKIVAVNGALVAGMNVYNIIQLILGEPGSVVRLDIESPRNNSRMAGVDSAARQKSAELASNRRQLSDSKGTEIGDGKLIRNAGVVSKFQDETTRKPVPIGDPPVQNRQPEASDSKEPQGSISVKVLKATKIRLLGGDKKPRPCVQLRISGGIPPGSRYKTAGIPDTTTPEWNETIVLPVLDVEKAQLECSLWDEYLDRSQTKKNENFLGEVVLNLAKLKPYQGKYIEQVFEIKQSKIYQCDLVATGKLKLGLKLSVPAVGPFSQPWKSQSGTIASP